MIAIKAIKVATCHYDNGRAWIDLYPDYLTSNSKGSN